METYLLLIWPPGHLPRGGFPLSEWNWISPSFQTRGMKTRSDNQAALASWCPNSASSLATP